MIMVFVFAKMEIPSFNPVVLAMILVIQTVFVYLHPHILRPVAIT